MHKGLLRYIKESFHLWAHDICSIFGRQHPDYKYQPRRRRGGPGGTGVASGGRESPGGKEEPLTPPHTPSEEERCRPNQVKQALVKV